MDVTLPINGSQLCQDQIPPQTHHYMLEVKSWKPFSTFLNGQNGTVESVSLTGAPVGDGHELHQCTQNSRMRLHKVVIHLPSAIMCDSVLTALHKK